LDDVVELTDTSIDEFFELSGNLSLIEAITMFSFILIIEHRFEYIKLMGDIGMCIFVMSLTDATIQDSSIREKSNA